jgi:hypothetical protein
MSICKLNYLSNVRWGMHYTYCPTLVVSISQDGTVQSQAVEHFNTALINNLISEVDLKLYT